MLIVKNNQVRSDNDISISVTDKGSSDKLLITFLIAYIVPIFGLYGIFILPDSGLVLGLSIMLWTSDNILREGSVSLRNSIFLGIGLGIGLLSKYHILPLGGGMLLGLYLDLIFLRHQGLVQNNISRPINKLGMDLAWLIFSMLVGLLISMPLFVWNYANHYASFVFQLQHGFNSNSWQLTSMFGFILGALLYLTPWFAYMLVRYGLLKLSFWKARSYYVLVPVISLSLILIISSLRKNILPHWLSPAIWLLIPYAVINSDSLRLKSLKSMCKYTSMLWLILLFILLMPGGILNIKKVTKLFNPDTTGLADLLLWSELPQLFGENTQIGHSLTTLNNPVQNCHSTYKLIGTARWYWAAQLEYHKVFTFDYKILNLDLQSSNFYTWRDNLASFANCPVLVVSDRDNLPDLANLIDIQKSYKIHGIGDYKSLNLMIVEGVFKNTKAIASLQQKLLDNPHY